MLETAIIGGGLGGLALAAELAQRGQEFCLFEARARLGGRILTKTAAAGAPVDLGAAWHWPENQPLIAALAARLGLQSFAQHDDGTALRMAESDGKTEKVFLEGGVHGGARRIAGGAGQLIAALAAQIPQGALQSGCRLVGLRDGVDHVVLTLEQDGATRVVEAKRVVLALPPRLIAEKIAFAPALEAPTLDLLRDAATWMGAAAKVVATFKAAPWRDVGHSGNGFVSHEMATMDEVFDCAEPGGVPALGGFLALDAQNRAAFATGLTLLMESQFDQLFGMALPLDELFYQDWAAEADTCAELDLMQGRVEHRLVSNPLLRRPQWGGKLMFGSAETGARQAGYMEGAIEAAERNLRLILRDSAEDAAERLPGESVNAASLRRFSAFVARDSAKVFDVYRKNLNISLAAQDREQLTQRAMLGAVEDFFYSALAMIDALPFEGDGVFIEKGRCSLTPLAQKPFGDFLKGFFDEVAAFNATSCALSNFPSEHKLAKDYVQAIMRDVAAAWTEFSLALNGRLIAKCGAPDRADGAAA